MNLRSNIEKQWYGKPTWLWLLLPLSGVFWGLSRLRKKKLQKKAFTPACPTIIVGNISVGGTGKTPLIIALVDALKNAGLDVVVISRGYGANSPESIRHSVIRVPIFEDSPTAAAEYGDEPLMIARQTQATVLICRNRVLAAEAAAKQYQADVVLCDDGMQHYALGRSFEIAVIDASRGIGNGWCLPVGPLRELPNRLKLVDWVVVNGEVHALPEDLKGSLDHNSVTSVQLQPIVWVNVKTGERKALTDLFLRTTVSAIAGIGHPERFFSTLNQLGVAFKAYPFPDHHHYQPSDFSVLPSGPVVMTEKDAVKCQACAKDNWWYLAVEFNLPKVFTHAVIEHCKSFRP